METRGVQPVPSEWTNKLSRSLVTRGEIMLKAGEAEDARKLAQSVLDKDRDHLPAMELCARALWSLKQYSALQDLVPRMIRMNPYEPGYHALKGSVHFQLGQFAEAIDSYERSMKLPSRPEESVRASVAALRDYQQMLAAALLEEDQVFRAKYAQNPDEAVQSMGLRVGPNGETPEYRPKARVVRPS